MRSIPAGGSIRTEPATAEALDKKPNAPRSLDDIGQRYWREYAAALVAAGQLFEADLATLEDLCFWESVKHRGRDELPGGKLYMEYKDADTGRVSHTQPHAAFSNLKSIQSTVLALRGKLGLTLSDRSGLKVAKRGAVDKSSIAKSKGW